MLLLAEDGNSGELLGSCGMNVQLLTANGARSGRGDEVLTERPFMSNLAVARAYRKRGIASQEAPILAHRSWEASSSGQAVSESHAVTTAALR